MKNIPDASIQKVMLFFRRKQPGDLKLILACDAVYHNKTTYDNRGYLDQHSVYGIDKQWHPLFSVEYMTIHSRHNL